MQIHDYATQGDCDGALAELRLRVPVDARDERDYTPLACAASSSKADVEMLRLLIRVGANVDAHVDRSKRFPIGLAASSGDLAKTQCLLAAGANINLASRGGYTALINVVYALHDDNRLVPVCEFLVKNGATIDCKTAHGESPLGVAARLERFDAVKYLLEAGADPSPLGWTALHRAIAVETWRDVERLMDSAIDGGAQDRCGRTPWLLAACVGELKKSELLRSTGVDLNERGRSSTTALMLSSTNGSEQLVRWLLEQGADVDAVDDSGNSALMSASQAGHTDCVQLLLEAGANALRVNDYHQTAMSLAANEPIARLLVRVGEDLGHAGTELKRMLIGLAQSTSLTVGRPEYLSGNQPRFGTSNPEVMKVPFWNDMVRAGCSAYRASEHFGDTERESTPVWCFDRYGMSFTELPDGRFVQIGGEHEDHYDPDFQIYNDVIVHERSGTFQLMGYPGDVFPPTDFHSATHVDGYIYIVGGLGYHGSRRFGLTRVFRLYCRTWSMEAVETSGEMPGWIFKHKAEFAEPGLLTISGGTICELVDGHEQHRENDKRFALNLANRTWMRL